MERGIVLLLVLGIVAPVAAAGSTPELVAELRFSDPDSWVGVSRDELVAKWGKPTKVKSGREGEVLLFERSVMMGFAAAGSSEVSYSREKNEDGKNRLVPDATPNLVTDVVFEKKKFKFWLDQNGSVSKVKFPADLKADPHGRTFVTTPMPDAIPDPGRP